MVTFLPKEANLALLMGRCVSIMHGFICKHNIEGVGVSLPAWTDETIGNAIAFIHHDKNVLDKLKNQSYFQDMTESGFFKISSVTLVPDECEEVRFKRNQGIGKMYAADSRRRLKRLEKRAVARGDFFNPNKTSALREFDTFHRIPISSGSNQQDYILHIQKGGVNDQEEPIFSKYGFASNEKFMGTVPDLSSEVLSG